MSENSQEEEYRVLLPGKWHIVATNFPLWLTGKRLRPKFQYVIIPDKERLILSDDVSYETSRGVEKHILGIDTFDPSKQLFTWRGKGFLRLFKSRWSIRYISPSGDLAVIEFTKSLVTPAGTDIILRDGVSIGSRQQDIASNPKSIGVAQKEHASLVWLDQGN